MVSKMCLDVCNNVLLVDTQPYAHVGIYSEGEFAVSPTIVQLAAQRKLPASTDWDTAMLGQDEGKIPP